MYPKIQQKTASINNYLMIHVSRRFSEIYCHLSPNTLKSWTLGGQSPPLCAQKLSKTCLGYARLFTPPPFQIGPPANLIQFNNYNGTGLTTSGSTPSTGNSALQIE